MNTNTETSKIDLACENFKEIKNNIINNKFKNIDNWLYDISTKYKEENNIDTEKTYQRFDYGTIVKVDFGINIGSELCSPHFAIVLDKYDSVKNPIITVLPLSSKNKKRYLVLNNLITYAFTERINKFLKDANEELDILLKSENTSTKIINEKIREIKNLNKKLRFYANYSKKSFGCTNLITTISKDKILKPKNKYDIIGRSKCNSKTMKIISQEILKKFTNIQ